MTNIDLEYLSEIPEFIGTCINVSPDYNYFINIVTFAFGFMMFNYSWRITERLGSIPRLNHPRIKFIFRTGFANFCISVIFFIVSMMMFSYQTGFFVNL